MFKKIVVALIILGAIMALLLSSCSITETRAADPLDGTSWQLQYYRKTAPISGTTITAQFADGEISGSAGCNKYGGVYEVDGSEISIGEIYFTEMACMEPAGVIEQEQQYLGYLGEAYKFQLAEDQLLIHWTAQETLTFVPENRLNN